MEVKWVVFLIMLGIGALGFYCGKKARDAKD